MFLKYYFLLTKKNVDLQIKKRNWKWIGLGYTLYKDRDAVEKLALS